MPKRRGEIMKMKKRYSIIAILMLAVICLIPFSAFASSVSVTGLLDENSEEIARLNETSGQELYDETVADELISYRSSDYGAELVSDEITDDEIRNGVVKVTLPVFSFTDSDLKEMEVSQNINVVYSADRPIAVFFSGFEDGEFKCLNLIGRQFAEEFDSALSEVENGDSEICLAASGLFFVANKEDEVVPASGSSISGDTEYDVVSLNEYINAVRDNAEYMKETDPDNESVGGSYLLDFMYGKMKLDGGSSAVTAAVICAAAAVAAVLSILIYRKKRYSA
jgi:hypothetical protein